MRLTMPFVIAGLAIAAVPVGAQDPDRRIVVHEVLRTAKARAYQGRNAGPEQTERFSRKVRIGRDGRVSISNISGDIVVTGGSGDEVSIEAVKRARGDRSELARVEIVVEERAGRVDVRAEHDRYQSDRGRRGDSASVDFTVTVPASASLDVHSVSGSLKVTGVRGAVRAETVSGNVTTTDTPNLEHAKSVSGDVSLTGAAAEGDLSAGSVSGSITARGLKARGLDLGSVSGDVIAHRCHLRPADRQVGQRQRRVRGRDRAQRALRNQFAFRDRAPGARQPVRLRAEREQLQRFDPVGSAADDRWRLGAGSRLDPGTAPRGQQRAQHARDLRRRQRDAHHPDVQRGHHHRQTVGRVDRSPSAAAPAAVSDCTRPPCCHLSRRTAPRLLPSSV